MCVYVWVQILEKPQSVGDFSSPPSQMLSCRLLSELLMRMLGTKLGYSSKAVYAFSQLVISLAPFLFVFDADNWLMFVVHPGYKVLGYRCCKELLVYCLSVSFMTSCTINIHVIFLKSSSRLIHSKLIATCNSSFREPNTFWHPQVLALKATYEFCLGKSSTIDITKIF